jgi:hypothetical protein
MLIMPRFRYTFGKCGTVFTTWGKKLYVYIMIIVRCTLCFIYTASTVHYDDAFAGGVIVTKRDPEMMP